MHRIYGFFKEWTLKLLAFRTQRHDYGLFVIGLQSQIRVRGKSSLSVWTSGEVPVKVEKESIYQD